MNRINEVCEKYETTEYQSNKIQIHFEANKFCKRIRPLPSTTDKIVRPSPHLSLDPGAFFLQMG
jgi:hypothetical protein